MSFLVGGCSLFDGPQSFVRPYGPVADRQYYLFMITCWVTLFIFVVVTGVMMYAVLRFRVKEGEPEGELPPQVHGNAIIEGGLGVAAALLLLIIAVPTVQVIFWQDTVPNDYAQAGVAALSQATASPSASGAPSPAPSGEASSAPAAGATPGVLELVVTGHQWWWQFDFPDLGVTTADEFHIPVGVPIDIKLHSKDVIHSFWVPSLAGKTDVIPGQENHMWFEASKPGEYYGHCTEFCGGSHALMRFRCIADTPADFAKWLAHEKSDVADATTLEQMPGYKIFVDQCARCHTVGGTDAMGTQCPNLTHLKERKMFAGEAFPDDDKDLHEWIHDPPEMKPGEGITTHDPQGETAEIGMPDLHLSDDQINEVVQFLDKLQ
ncbi:MAG: cytochrome c oxidase subunit II [Candidatus Xenobia bacterium]